MAFVAPFPIGRRPVSVRTLHTALTVNASVFQFRRAPRPSRLPFPRASTSAHSASSLPNPPTASTNTPPSKASVTDLIRLCLPELRHIIIGAVASLASSSLLLLTPIVFGRVLDVIASFRTAASQQGLAQLSGSARILFIVYLLGAILKMAEVALMRIAGERVVASLRRKVFSTIIRSDVATLEKSSTGELVSRLSADTIALQRVMTTDVVQLLQGFLETCVACAMLLILCKPLAPIIFIVVPMSVLAGMRYGYHTAKLAKSLSSALAQASAVATEQMDGIRIVKSFAREGFAEAAYDTRVGEVLEFGHRSAWADGILQGWNRVVFTMNTCTILLLGGRLVAQGVLSVGGMMAFVLYSSHLTAALGKLSLGIGEVMRARGSADRILNLLGTKPVIEKHISKQFADIGYGVDLRPRVSGDVSFRNVTFKYPSSDRVILRNLDFDIPAGGSVAFVGGSGAGKSTTSALLSRFYDPLSGEIFVDGKSLKDYDLRDVRQNIVGIISQEPYIISGTLADNIAFGRANASREEIEEAAEAAGVLAFAHKFPQGLDTVVTRLSSGEKQRVMIARCLAKKPQIMVLDEPTSALDRSSEAFVNETIERLIRDTKRTVILISHRLATVRCCEKILVFSNGEVVENGSHEDLVERGGAYCRLLNAVI